MPEKAAGLLLEREVSTLVGLLVAPDRPLVAVLGGAKVSDKILVIERFLEVADTVLIIGSTNTEPVREAIRTHGFEASAVPSADPGALCAQGIKAVVLMLGGGALWLWLC